MNKSNRNHLIHSPLKKTYPLIIIGTALLLSNCASMDKSLLLGAGTGSAVGGGMGYGIGQNATGTLIGLGVGAVLGGTLGYLSHKEKEDKMELLKMTTRKKDLNKNLPSLRAPEASCTRVDEKIEGSQFIGAHILCTIEKPAVWSK